MEIKCLAEDFSVCQVVDFSQVDIGQPYVFISRTDEECSLVCPVERVPRNTTQRDDGWRAFRIEGVLDFGLVGILAKISGLLAEQKISIFAVSTYNTDYVLVKTDKSEQALAVLKDAGYRIK